MGSAESYHPPVTQLFGVPDGSPHPPVILAVRRLQHLCFLLQKADTLFASRNCSDSAQGAPGQVASREVAQFWGFERRIVDVRSHRGMVSE